jgi:hypothetical protein
MGFVSRLDRCRMNAIRDELHGMPLPIRWAIVGSASAGVTGAIVGLAAGLRYPPTAWFAIFELGVPAALAGAIVGLVVGLIVAAGHRIARADRPIER